MFSQKFYIVMGSILAGLSVVLGAFGAHALKADLQAQNRFDAYETAVRYQMYHGLGLLLLVLLWPYLRQGLAHWAAWCFLVGILIFSGSLYVVCLSGVGKWGIVTPVGGLLFVLGWVLVALAALKKN